MKISLQDKDLNSVVVSYLRRGALIVFPTDTCYGLCTIGLRSNDKAIERVYQVKERPLDKPLSLFLTTEMLDRYVNISPIVRKLINRFWPGPLTLVLQADGPKNRDLSSLLNINSPYKIGFRDPDQTQLRKIIQTIDVPITGTSANISSTKSIYDFDEIYNSLKLTDDDLWVDGGCLDRVLPSTVVDLTHGDQMKILREGTITSEDLRETLKLN